MENLQFGQKMSLLHIQICDNPICMPIIVSEVFFEKNLQFYVFICNPQFYDTYVR